MAAVGTELSGIKLIKGSAYIQHKLSVHVYMAKY